MLIESKPKIDYILIACCTCCRNHMLAMVLWYVAKLNLPKGIKTELLIVDNGAQAPAKDIVDNFAKNFPIKIHYILEEKRGIAPARNRLLKEAVKLGASHIALFDDDGLVDENWLINHVEMYNNIDAQIISGPQYTWFDDNYPKYIMNNNIFKVSSTKKRGEELLSCATNNVFLPTEIYYKNNIYFDKMYIYMGGEDGDFFYRLHNLGYKIVFNPNSIVREIADATRVNSKWVISRSYYNGYSGSFLKFRYQKSTLNKLLYILKLIFVIILDFILLPISIFLGRKSILNTICITAKNIGKFVGSFSNKTMNYYENITEN